MTDVARILQLVAALCIWAVKISTPIHLDRHVPILKGFQKIRPRHGRIYIWQTTALIRWKLRNLFNMCVLRLFGNQIDSL
jgi:hypothetical protein